MSAPVPAAYFPRATTIASASAAAPGRRTGWRRWCLSLLTAVVLALAVPTAARADTAFTTAPRPTIAGYPAVGVTLVADPGTWTPTPTSITYQWYASGVAIAGATTSQLTLDTAQQGLAVTVVATATRDGYVTTSRASLATNAIQGAYTNVPTPVVVGSAVKGQTLSVDVGAWTPTPDQYWYEWLADGSVIPGQTSATLLLDDSLVGRQISVGVRGQKDDYYSAYWFSDRTTPVLDTFETGTPTVSGTPQVGQTLSVDPGGWSPADGVDYAYQWYADGARIADATSDSVTLPGSVAGQSVAVAVTASKDGFADATVMSASTTQVAKGSWSVTKRVTVAGSSALGGTLTATGPVTSIGADTSAYQWFAAGVAIKGATSRSFTATSAQIGKKLTVRVTVSKLGYPDLTSATRTSHPVGIFWKTYAPSISGTMAAGHTVKAVTGSSWQPSPTRWAYQWYVDGKKVAGATRSTFTISAARRGHRLSVRVTAVRSGYVSVERSSAVTTVR